MAAADERPLHASGGARDSRLALAAVSELAARSFPTIDEAIDATLALMQRLLGMEVRMVNQVTGDQLLFRRMQLPDGFPALEGLVTPLDHNF